MNINRHTKLLGEIVKVGHDHRLWVVVASSNQRYILESIPDKTRISTPAKNITVQTIDRLLHRYRNVVPKCKHLAAAHWTETAAKEEQRTAWKIAKKKGFV